MSFLRAVSAGLAVAIVACGPISRKLPRSGGDLPPPNETPYSFDAVARGRIVFDNACIRCHGLDASTESAPAMRDVAIRYHEAFFDEAAAVDRIAIWIGAPSGDEALLPDSATGHWSLMKRVALDRDLAEDVGHFIWSLAAIPRTDTGQATTR